MKRAAFHGLVYGLLLWAIISIGGPLGPFWWDHHLTAFLATLAFVYALGYHLGRSDAAR